MLDSLEHRGPDDRGYVSFSQVALGNTRLSIIDIEHGHQPISNEDETIVVVFNGEIYNFPELRCELEKKGHKFRTHSDTEIIVHLYEEEGEKFVDRLNGIFAFALYDLKLDLLLIARDRFGVKPLFYSDLKGEIRFASEIKALTKLPGFNPAVSPEGLSVAMGLFFICDPWTIYRDIARLKPGHYLRISRNGVQDIEYTDWKLHNKIDICMDEAAEYTALLLKKSVKRQMISDVPVGVLLSGGLDSRTILYLASKEKGDMDAFTIGFTESAFCEGDQAQKWAHAIGARHHLMNFTENDFCTNYINRSEHLDEPYALWCNVASAQMARYIHNAGFKVIVGGDGGDELFLGYPTINAAVAARIYQLIPLPLRQRVISPIVQSLPAGDSRLPVSFMLKSFVGADDPDLFRTFFGFKEVLRFNTWKELLTPEVYSMVRDIDPFIAHRQYLSKVEGLHLVDALSYMDFKVFLPGACLYGADNAYMASSVELRLPFLDNDLADFAGCMPVNVRFQMFKTKSVLQKALKEKTLTKSEHQTRAVLKRYRKAGFEIPGTVWLRRNRFQALIKDILSPQRLSQTGVFRPAAIANILEQQLSGTENNERIIQAVCSISLFFERGGYMN